MFENAKTKAVWTAGSGPQRVTHWGEHPWSWWRKQVAGYRGDAPPRLSIRVRAWDGKGAPASGQDFAADDLRGAKTFAKSWTEQSTGSATVAGRVYLHGEGDFTAEDFGEYAFDAPKSFYIWQVDHDYMPINRRGPFSDQDEARREGRRIAQSAIYHQVTTLGDDPSHPGFALDRVFRAGSGEVFTMSMAERAAERLGEYRGNPEFRSGRMRVDYDDTSTRHVLAGAYRGKDIGERAMHSHLVFLKGDGEHTTEVRTACSQDVDNVADAYSVARGEEHARPTCPRCATAFDKICGGRTPNSSGYYVWVMQSGTDVPMTTEGPFGPYHTLEGAKPFARISATKGNHDRTVSLGRDPRTEEFKVVRRYRARTGKRVI